MRGGDIMARISVFDIVGNEAFEAIDKLGYDFLEANGYPSAKARKYPNEREKLSRRLRTGKVELILNHRISDSDRAVFFWYVLKRRGKEIAKSEMLVVKERGTE